MQQIDTSFQPDEHAARALATGDVHPLPAGLPPSSASLNYGSVAPGFRSSTEDFNSYGNNAMTDYQDRAYGAPPGINSFGQGDGTPTTGRQVAYGRTNGGGVNMASDLTDREVLDQINKIWSNTETA